MKNPPYPVRMVDFSIRRENAEPAPGGGGIRRIRPIPARPISANGYARRTASASVTTAAVPGRLAISGSGAAPSTSIGLCPCAAAPQPAGYSPHRSLRWTADANGAQFFDAAAGTSRGSPARHRSPAPARLGREQNPHEWASDHRPWRWSGGFQADGPWNTGEEKTACKS